MEHTTSYIPRRDKQYFPRHFADVEETSRILTQLPRHHEIPHVVNAITDAAEYWLRSVKSNNGSEMKAWDAPIMPYLRSPYLKSMCTGPSHPLRKITVWVENPNSLALP